MNGKIPDANGETYNASNIIYNGNGKSCNVNGRIKNMINVVHAEKRSVKFTGSSVLIWTT